MKTYEKGAIVATFNTDSFHGQRGATLTVIIDQPFYAEVQLHDRGYIRTDVDVRARQRPVRLDRPGHRLSSRPWPSTIPAAATIGKSST